MVVWGAGSRAPRAGPGTASGLLLDLGARGRLSQAGPTGMRFQRMEFHPVVPATLSWAVGRAGQGDLRQTPFERPAASIAPHAMCPVTLGPRGPRPAPRPDRRGVRSLGGPACSQAGVPGHIPPPLRALEQVARAAPALRVSPGAGQGLAGRTESTLGGQTARPPPCGHCRVGKPARDKDERSTPVQAGSSSDGCGLGGVREGGLL